MTYIIVNADDFGYSDGVCKSILELLDAGAITGTSIMCAAEGAYDRFARWNVSALLGWAGVHLQLTSGRPISPPEDVPTLIDPTSGRFRDPRVGLLPDPAEVGIEWRRQVAAAHEVLHGAPTHLDSHHGVHRIPELFAIYADIASELRVPIRGSDGDIATTMRARRIPGTVALVRKWTGLSLGPQALREMVAAAVQQWPNERAVEVISHPGYTDEHLARISRLSAAREDDHAALLELVRSGWPTNDGHSLAPHSCLLEDHDLTRREA